MSILFAKVRRTTGESVVEVGVEVFRSVEFQSCYRLLTPAKVVVTDGESFSAAEIEDMCMCGARQARMLFVLASSRIVIRSAKGKIARSDLVGFAIAITLAIGRKLRCEHLIPEAEWSGASGSWKRAAACRGDSIGAANAVVLWSSESRRQTVAKSFEVGFATEVRFFDQEVAAERKAAQDVP